ncbi:MAG: SUMF1/EgtB/PvdO family nonheme iron enzyme [Pseudomonadota bacterium]
MKLSTKLVGSEKRRGRLSARIALVAVSLALVTPRLAGATPPPDFASLTAAAPTTATAPVSLGAQSGMISIPAGRYPLGTDTGATASRPAHTVTLWAFAIDRTEVTNAAFAEFLNALGLALGSDVAAGALRLDDAPKPAVDLLAEGRRGTGRYPLIALDDDQARIGIQAGRFVPTPGYGDHPVTETTWAGARAYCRWRGARLPSEAEWEAAARGMDGRVYPWGDAPPDDRLAFVIQRTGQTAPVGSRPAGASPFGLLDMAGSLAEWTSSLRRPYPYDPTDGREDPDQAGERVTRGGDYIYDTAHDALTAVHRTGFSNAPERGHRHIGFRCARSDG